MSSRAALNQLRSVSHLIPEFLNHHPEGDTALNSKSSAIIARSLILTLIVFAVSLTAAQAAQPRRFGHLFLVKEFLYDHLNITEEQQEQLEILRQDTRSAMQPYVEEIKPIADELTRVLLCQSVDAEKAVEFASRIAQIEVQMAPIMSDAIIQAAEILTTEQRAVIAESMSGLNDFIQYVLDYPGFHAVQRAGFRGTPFDFIDRPLRVR